MRRLPALVLVLVAILAASAFAQEQEGGEPRTVRVTTTIAPPFVIEGADGELSGIDVELWERVAERMGVQTQWDVKGGVPDALDAVRAGDADAGLAALTISREREATLDFSHAYYNTGLGIAVAKGRSGGLGLISLVSGLFSLAFLQAVGALSLVLLISGLLMWMFERKSNAEQFKAGVRGLGDGFWWSAVTMTTVGYGDKAPVTMGGRLVALVWMFTSIIIIAAFTGSIASAITVGALDGKVRGPEDLPGVRVAAPAGTTAVDYLVDNGVRPTEVESVDDALRLLEAGEVDAVVHDAPVLQSLIRQRPDLSVLEATFAPQSYGIALQQGSEMREAVNRAVLAETGSSDWKDLLERYLGP
ncbi:MAG: transporter substrate-binding domain-containing protein [Phycisphaerales bacterium JB064]